MRKIQIAEGVTATLTEKTYKAMREYEAESDKLRRWQHSAYEERDWGEWEHYNELSRQLDEKFAWLWG